jgi:GlcNAc-P-P-Und epimerase
VNVRTCVIFGGTGCIGTHVARFLLENTRVERVYLADLRPVRPEAYAQKLVRWTTSGGTTPARLAYVDCDVRRPIECTDLQHDADLIVNLAAVHREPGHAPNEYYETNIPGAEHVCAYASRVGCKRIIFASSISPYGSSDAVRNEDSTPMPETPYGGSKLAAEKIHIAWQSAEVGRKLIILRPGVVFGPGEHANVARLARSLGRGYFVYMGNRGTRKAGVYVKEIPWVIEFALEIQEASSEPLLIWNVSMDPPPTLENFVEAICAVSGFKKPKISVPRSLLVAVSYPVAATAKLLGRTSSINPVRMRKLSQPTHIDPLRLRAAGYRFRYTLEQAMSDWRQDAPEDFQL